MTRILLAFGSNLGDREANLRSAVDAFANDIVLVSGVYETPPWGDEDQPAYLNAVAMAVNPGRSPEQWLEAAHHVEDSLGRVRDPERRFGPRTVDIDLIMAWTDDGEYIRRTDPDLTLPHPRAHLRAFVLRPWLEIQPYASLPGHGWVNDLILTEPLASDALAMTPRPDIRLD